MRCRRPFAASNYFFLRAVFLAGFFALAFAFLFFAIAALLALSGWRYQYSAVANRSALHSDYYKRKKITVTPLNFAFRRRAFAALRTTRSTKRRDIAANFFCCARLDAKISAR
jgi:hypothetical protein